jgi:hypothetical protein
MPHTAAIAHDNANRMNRAKYIGINIGLSQKSLLVKV